MFETRSQNRMSRSLPISHVHHRSLLPCLAAEKPILSSQLCSQHNSFFAEGSGVIKLAGLMLSRGDRCFQWLFVADWNQGCASRTYSNEPKEHGEMLSSVTLSVHHCESAVSDIMLRTFCRLPSQSKDLRWTMFHY